MKATASFQSFESSLNFQDLSSRQEQATSRAVSQFVNLEEEQFEIKLDDPTLTTVEKQMVPEIELHQLKAAASQKRLVDATETRFES